MTDALQNFLPNWLDPKHPITELYLFVKDKLHGSQSLSTTDGDNLSVSESHRLDTLMVEVGVFFILQRLQTSVRSL